MRSLLRHLGKAILMMGILFVCIALVGLFTVGTAVLLPRTLIPDTIASLFDQITSIWRKPYMAFQPDEFVYDYSLGADVPRIYYISIPKLGLHAPVVAVSSHSVQIDGKNVSRLHVPNAFAVGWSDTSAAVGQRGNTIFAGHNNEFGEVFKDLWYLQAGDEIIVETASGDRRYRVSQTVTFEEKGYPLKQRLANASWIQPTRHEQLTLVTCWPYYTNTHRFVVVAHPVDGG